MNGHIWGWNGFCSSCGSENYDWTRQKLLPTRIRGIEMKKKILNLVFLLSLLAMPVMLASCGSDNDDDDINNGTIHPNAEMLQGGTWTFQKAIVSIMGQTIEMDLDEIRQLYAQDLGTNNIMFIDEYIKFEKDYMVMVNTGDRYAYKYYSNGTLWIEGIDELAGTENMNLTIKVKSLSQKQLVMRYSIKMPGFTMDEDVYYTR